MDFGNISSEKYPHEKNTKSTKNINRGTQTMGQKKPNIPNKILQKKNRKIQDNNKRYYLCKSM